MGKELLIDVNKVGVRTAFNITEIVIDPERFLIIDLNERMLCMKCNHPLTIHSTQKATTYRCGCGCRIIYYPKYGGQKRLSTWIPIDEYLRGLNAGKN
jgi:hypothetical protein